MREERTSSAMPPTSGGQGLSPAERSLRARLAAHAMHGQHDARATTANARAAFLTRFERQADPEGLLPPAERQRRAQQLRSAYFARLALASAKARRARRTLRPDRGTPSGFPEPNHPEPVEDLGGDAA
jgi:hypothetical protein